jgi:hypothetical protein
LSNCSTRLTLCKDPQQVFPLPVEPKLRREEGIVASPEPMAKERVGSVALQGKVYVPSLRGK